MRIVIGHVFALLFVLAGLSASTVAHSGSLSVDGTRFVSKTDDRKSLRGAELVGVELDVGDGTKMRIDTFIPGRLVANGRSLRRAYSNL